MLLQAWFVFSGNGSQWPGMAVSLIKSHLSFQASIKASANHVIRFGIDLLSAFYKEDGFRDTIYSALGLAAVQIALVDMLELDYGVRPEGMLGHSAG